MLHGIDVSVWQGEIDWGKVKGAGKDFAIIRLGWAGYDGGIISNGGLDKKFKENMKGAASAGIPVGVYVYSYCKSASAARKAALETLDLVKGYRLEYPIAFDIEDKTYLDMTIAENTAITDAFLSVIENGGYYGMLYTFKSFAENNLNMKDLARYDFWLAQFNKEPTYSRAFGMWQYSEAGKVDGISGSVDLDVAYQDYPFIIKNAGLNGFIGSTVNDLEQGAAECKDCTDKEKYFEAIRRIKQIADEVLE